VDIHLERIWDKEHTVDKILKVTSGSTPEIGPKK
jgi:hypothetical protein